MTDPSDDPNNVRCYKPMPWAWTVRIALGIGAAFSLLGGFIGASALLSSHNAAAAVGDVGFAVYWFGAAVICGFSFLDHRRTKHTKPTASEDRP